MAKLYELSEQYKRFNDYVNDALDNEDLTEDTLQMFIDTLDGIKDSIEVKVENIAKFLKNIESDIKAYKTEEERLATKRKYLTNKFEGIKEYTKNMLEFAKIDKVQAGTFSVRLQKNPPSIEILDETKIPKEYKIPQPDKVDTKTILAELKSGKEIAGVKLADEKKHLRIS